jgi:tetratricopeptide (TPR) repeat protein
MLDALVYHMEASEYLEGILNIEHGNYDTAENYFKERLSQDNHLVYYGLATARFYRDPVSMTKAQTQDIIDLYEKSISKKPDFADSYLMCAMAYEQLASVLTREYKREPYNSTDKRIQGIKSALDKALERIREAIRLNPGFEDIAKPEIVAFSKRIESLDQLREYYDTHRNLFN